MKKLCAGVVDGPLDESFTPVKRLTLMLVSRFFTTALTFAVLAGNAGYAQQPVRAKHLTVELLARGSALVPGHDALLGLQFKLEPGWHIYWSNAGDSGEPPDIKWTLPPGFTTGAVQFPAPRRLPLGPLMDFGYEDAVLFPVPLQVATTVAQGPTSLSADVRWLVCREVCIPGKATLALRIPIAPSAVPNPATAADFQRALDSLPTTPTSQTRTEVRADAANFYITVRTGHRESAAQFFPFEQSQIANAAPQPARALSDGVQLTVRKDDSLKINPAKLSGVVELSDGRNYLLASLITPGAPLAPVQSQAGFGEMLRIAALAFLGGIILNLMPCVFPVLFIKGLGLLQSHGMERAQARRHGGVYTLGILVSFWIIVGALLAVRAGGSLAGWGFQFQSPTFVAIITLLLFFFGLSLAGMFEFGLSLTSAGGALAQREGYSGSFFTGMLATVVATPCTAPFMGAAVGFALSQSIAVTFLIFTALALGLALPYVLLTFFPAWMRILPKPGAWMEVLKQAASIPIFATVIWLLWLYAKLAGTDLLVWVMASLLLTAIGGWMLHRWIRNSMGTVAAVLILLLAVVLPVYGQRQARSAKVTWQPWSAAVVTSAQQQGQPVFVDFTAAWCLSCQFNERSVLDSTAVEEAMERAHVVRLRADWTHYDADITAALASLNRSGVPTYVIYPATNDAQSTNPGPVVLPEALTQGIVLDALHKLTVH